MDTFCLRIFQCQVLDQCQYVILAAQEMNSALKQPDNTRIFYAIQNLLNAGANISKMLWGSGGKQAENRKQLRDSIGVSDSSPLRDVTMRNNFEHMDERIDRWWAESKHHNHISKIVGPRNAITGFDDIDTFRWFDPSNTDVIFWGQSFNIQSLVTEVIRVLPKLKEEADKPHFDKSDIHQ